MRYVCTSGILMTLLSTVKSGRSSKVRDPSVRARAGQHTVQEVARMRFHSSLNQGVKRSGAAASSASSASTLMKRQSAISFTFTSTRTVVRRVDPAQLVLGAELVVRGLVGELVEKLERARRRSSCTSRRWTASSTTLAAPRMAAAAVRPVAAATALLGAALLEQHAAAPIEDEQRERAMQDAVAVVARRLAA